MQKLMESRLKLAVLAIAGLCAVLVFVGCGSRNDVDETVSAVRPQARPAVLWDHRPEAARWTSASLLALDTHGAPLVDLVPGDIQNYCPGYENASRDERKAFWVNLVAGLAKHESTFRPDAAGGDGKWHGLVQIAPATARGYGCVARSASDLHVGALNLSCAIRIMTATVGRDGVISRGMRGVAADWGPFHQERKRTDIQAWTSSQPYCQE